MRIPASHAEQEKITLSCTYIEDCFEELIAALHKKTAQRVVVLVDEYDKPILDNIEEPETAREIRDGLRNFYSVHKAQVAHLRFVMLTGVSKFSKVSLFSGLNKLYETISISFVFVRPSFGQPGRIKKTIGGQFNGVIN